MTKRMTHIFLAASILLECLAPRAAFAGAAPAAPTPRPAQTGRRPLTDNEILERTNSNYGRRLKMRYARRQINRMKNKVVEGAKEAPRTFARGTVNQGKHQLQTIVLISMLTMAEIVRENNKIADISRLNRTGEETRTILAQDFKEAANTMFNSPDYWGSVTGGFVAGAPNAGVRGILDKMLSNVSSRNIFKNLTTSGASTLVTFIGWEFFGELVSEARELIENDRDYERSRNFGALIKGFFNRSAGASFEDRENKRVMGLLFKNMAQILYYNSELRGLLISNTWRHRIATGQFVTLVSFMAAGGTAGAMAGTALFPGAGTIVGFAFGFLGGLVGGIATLVVPESWQNKLTGFFRDLRKGFWSIGTLFNTDKPSDVMELYFSAPYECITKKQPCPPVLMENLRTLGHYTYIDNYVTIMFEEFMFYEKEIAQNRDYLALAQAARNVEKVKLYSEHIQKAADTYRRKLNELNQQTYRRELNQMFALFKKYPIKQEWTRQYPQLQGLFDYYRTVKILTRGLEAFSRVSQAQMHSEQKLFLPTLYQIYFMGFTKKLFLESVTTAVRQVSTQ